MGAIFYYMIAAFIFILVLFVVVYLIKRNSKFSSSLKFEKKLSQEEMEFITILITKHYPDKNFVKIVAEKRQKRPAEEGLDTTEEGFDLLKSSGDIGVFYKISTGKYGCYIDTYSTPPFDFWYLVVSVFTN